MKKEDIIKNFRQIKLGKNTKKVEKEINDGPEIIFENLIQQIAVGQWLGVLPRYYTIGNSASKTYIKLDADELMNKIKISETEINEINTKFSQILKKVGVLNTEKCILSNCNSSTLSFKCNFNNSEKNAYINLNFGDVMNNPTEFIIDFENIERTYIYDQDSINDSINIKLNNYTITNPENGRILKRQLRNYASNFNLSDGIYNLQIDIESPINDINLTEIYKIKNEPELEQFLLNLELPCEINNLYLKILEISLESSKIYSNISLVVNKKTGARKSKVIDSLKLNNGEITEITITKNDTTVSLNKEENWSFNTPNLEINKIKEQINYNLFSISEEEISEINPAFQIQFAKLEVEKVKKLYMQTK
ncbi:MAG: hypothetical protein ACK5HP_04980 [Bacilli bacterium]